MAAAKQTTSTRKPKAKGVKKRARAPAGVTATLAEAAWLEADQALAQALFEFDGALRAENARTRAEAMDLLKLALARVTRRRGLTRFGLVGASCPFDPNVHELVGKPAKQVEIVTPGVRRGDEILVRALVRKPP